MRAFEKGKPFWDVPCECLGDYQEVYIEEGLSHRDIPVFSETFLYSCMFKDDARFILAVAGEYAALINLLGTERIVELLMEARKQNKEAHI